ncbi:organelle RRM domain-containing protein 6, chloroplastic-like [Macadamia integrifolia]|uniref:organelle RRM domain-containing protein 6, chloroplastic-like n=1 Tax=Macadamia integrifolia TaxID=60698 RepID=UPI001C531296|nr:organelle RRM domain-containing protein 6, chloroplastic-like [Macadamia integrifolia]
MAAILVKQLTGNRCLGFLSTWRPMLFSRRFSSQLFVSRLSFYTTQKDLKNLFEPFGTVTEARLIKDPTTQRPKGFGFVTFESVAEARKALQAMNGRIVAGRMIFVEVAKTTGPE